MEKKEEDGRSRRLAMLPPQVLAVGTLSTLVIYIHHPHLNYTRLPPPGMTMMIMEMMMMMMMISVREGERGG